MEYDDTWWKRIRDRDNEGEVLESLFTFVVTRTTLRVHIDMGSIVAAPSLRR